MNEYNFFADLFDTYQSLPDWLKLAWLVVPSGVMVACFYGYIYLRIRLVAPASPVKPVEMPVDIHEVKLCQEPAAVDSDNLPISPQLIAQKLAHLKRKDET